MKGSARSAKAVNCCRRTNVNGGEHLIFETLAGQRIILQDRPSAILVEDANGNSVRLDAGGITIQAAAKVTVNASIVEVAASEVSVNAAITTFSGIVQADSIIANHITPGAGNIW